VFVPQGIDHPADSALHHQRVVDRLIDEFVVHDLPRLPEGAKELGQGLGRVGCRRARRRGRPRRRQGGRQPIAQRRSGGWIQARQHQT